MQVPKTSILQSLHPGVPYSQVLSNLPALRELNLAFNYFTGIYFTPESAEYAFPLLESLNLGFNYIAHETDVERLVLLERLQRIILYGNPLAGPSGEDSLGLCVQALMDKADRYDDTQIHFQVSPLHDVMTSLYKKGIALESIQSI